MCSRFQWCVPGVDGKYVGPTAPSDPFASEQYAAQEAILQGLDLKHDAFRMQIVASVSYPQLDGASSSVNTEGKARVRWTIAQIIHRAGMTVETAQKLGGVLSARLRWNCALPIDGCQPTLIVTQLAPGRPFYREYANYYRHAPSDNTSYRELYQARGLRILVTVEGIGHKVSLYMIMLQIFVLLTLGTVRGTRLVATPLVTAPSAAQSRSRAARSHAHARPPPCIHLASCLANSHREFT